MRTYELMVIHRPELTEDDVRDLVKGIEDTMRGQDSEVKETDFWGKRRFAYEIEHIKEGYYSVLTFDSDSETVTLLDRALSLADSVVRHKIVRAGE